MDCAPRNDEQLCATPERTSMTQRWLRSMVTGAALLLLLGPAAIELYTDWLWFGETGYQSTFLRMLTARALLGVAAAAIAFAVMHTSMRVALRRVSPRQLVFMTRVSARRACSCASPRTSMRVA